MYFRAEIQGTGIRSEVTVTVTRSSAVAKRPLDVPCHWKFCCHSKVIQGHSNILHRWVERV